MTPEQRARAGRAVTDRISQLGTTPTGIARAAGVSANTVRALAKGQRWPHQDSRDRITRALGWRPGDLAHRALDGELASLSTVDLLMEIVRRVQSLEAAT